MQQLRRAMCLKPKSGCELFAFRSRSKAYILNLFQKSRRKSLYHRALLGLFDTMTHKHHPVSRITADRDELWWNAIKDLSTTARQADHAVRPTTGRRAALEDPLIEAFGLTWRHLIEMASSEEKHNLRHEFVNKMCASWGLPPLVSVSTIAHLERTCATVDIRDGCRHGV